jgi:hypothetical protein
MGSPRLPAALPPPTRPNNATASSIAMGSPHRIASCPNLATHFLIWVCLKVARHADPVELLMRACPAAHLAADWTEVERTQRFWASNVGDAADYKMSKVPAASPACALVRG